MNLATFIQSYEHMAGRLPYVLGRWEDFAPERQDSLSDELLRLLVRRREAVMLASDEMSFARIASADNIIRSWTLEIARAMGFRPSIPLLRARSAQPAGYSVASVAFAQGTAAAAL